jgi:oligopeptide transport system ATP-binding protein
VDELFRRPRHAYTRALMKSIPALQKKGDPLYTIPGMPPDLARLGPGCAFRVRNAEHGHLCLTDRDPELVEISPNHWVQNCPGCVERSAA